MCCSRQLLFFEPIPLSLYTTLSTCSPRTMSSASSLSSPFRWMLTFFLPSVVSHGRANPSWVFTLVANDAVYSSVCVEFT